MVGEVYILNLYLQKGTIPVFLEMSDRFFSIIQNHLANQDKTETANSPNMDHAMIGYDRSTAPGTGMGAGSAYENEIMADQEGKAYDQKA